MGGFKFSILLNGFLIFPLMWYYVQYTELEKTSTWNSAQNNDRIEELECIIDNCKNCSKELKELKKYDIQQSV